MGLRLAGALLGLWRHHSREGRSWLELVLAQPGAQARTAARAKAIRGAGLMAFFHGDYPEAQRLLEESVSIGREAYPAGRRDLANALATLAHVVLLQGNLTTALELARESLQLYQQVEDAWGTALALHHLGKATLELGDPGAARTLLEESVALFRMTGDAVLLALSLNTLGLVDLREDDYAAARVHFEEALAVAQETDDEQNRADALAHLGTVALRVDNYPQAAVLFQQSLALNQVQGYKDGIAKDLAGLAEVASLMGQPERAARLFGAVESLREASNISLLPLRRVEYDRTVEDIQIQLNDAAFAEVWANGRAMPLEQAITYALETKGAFPADAKPPEAKQKDASSLVPHSALSSPPLSPR